MGRVAYDPGELQSLAGQLTSSAASLLSVQSQVVAAASDPGLLPSGVALMAEAEAAVAGLVGVQTSMVNTAQQITLTNAAYEEATQSSPSNWYGFRPVLNSASWLSQEMGNLEFWMGDHSVNFQNSLGQQLEQRFPWLRPYMNAAHSFLGSQRNNLETVHNIFNVLGYVVDAASIAAMFVFPPADLVLVPLSVGISGVQLQTDELLVGGGDDSPAMKAQYGSDEVQYLASLMVFAKYPRDAMEGLPLATKLLRHPKALTAAYSVVEEGSTAAERVVSTVGDVAGMVVNYEPFIPAIAQAVPKYFPVAKQVAVHDIETTVKAAQQARTAAQQATTTAVDQARAKAEQISGEVDRINRWFQQHPGVVDPKPGPVPIDPNYRRHH
ncbi:MAG: hypothetical protein J2P57_22100 [Acidimicrobiaceae bacterium]|nr:hypothetical protein [Acidimicrobiaceae bacterium]